MADNAFAEDLTMLTANDDGRGSLTRQLLVVHTFEGRDRDARAMANYQLSPAAGGSYHLVVDKDGQVARENDDIYISWSAMYTANRRGWHVCLAGRAAYTRDQWLARTTQLDKLAEVLAAYSIRRNIPLVKLTPDQVRAEKRGVCGHADVSEAWHESDHTDPGPNFPWDIVLAKAEKIKESGTMPPTPPTTPPVADRKYPSFVDGRPLRFSEYLRFIDMKVTALYDREFPGEAPTVADGAWTDPTGELYPSYVDPDTTLSLDQYLRFIDLKITRLYERAEKTTPTPKEAPHA